MFAEYGRGLLIEFVEGNYSIDHPMTSQKAYALDDIVSRPSFGKIESLIDRVSRPVCVAMLLNGQQDHSAAQPMSLTQERVAFYKGSDAQYGQWRVLSHVRAFLREAAGLYSLVAPRRENPSASGSVRQ
jgi:hypothetical protein